MPQAPGRHAAQNDVLVSQAPRSFEVCHFVGNQKLLGSDESPRSMFENRDSQRGSLCVRCDLHGLLDWNRLVGRWHRQAAMGSSHGFKRRCIIATLA